MAEIVPSLIELLRDYARIVEAAPPPRRMIARHDVPFGRAYRMWSTRGEMIIYVSRGWIEDIPRAKRKTEPFGFDSAVFTGIPVILE